MVGRGWSRSARLRGLTDAMCTHNSVPHCDLLSGVVELCAVASAFRRACPPSGRTPRATASGRPSCGTCRTTAPGGSASSQLVSQQDMAVFLRRSPLWVMARLQLLPHNGSWWFCFLTTGGWVGRSAPQPGGASAALATPTCHLLPPLSCLPFIVPALQPAGSASAWTCWWAC